MPHCKIGIRSRSSFLRDSGFTYQELLLGLVISTLVFVPAYGFASAVLARRASDNCKGEEIEMALDVLARDIRCAADLPNEVPFHAHENSLSMTRASARGFEEVRYEIRADNPDAILIRNRAPLCRNILESHMKFFDGENWQDYWGWDFSKNQPMEGVRGLPLAVEIEIRDGDGIHRRVIPAMVAVIDRWLS